MAIGLAAFGISMIFNEFKGLGVFLHTQVWQLKALASNPAARNTQRGQLGRNSPYGPTPRRDKSR